MLKERGFVQRKLVKAITYAPSRQRDEQFEQLQQLREQFEAEGQPIFSLDSKRKESLGMMYREGLVFANQAAKVLDHDFPSYSEGEVVPHGIYDEQRNEAHLNLTTGSDTGEFAVSSLRWYWDQIGSSHYPLAERVLLLCDCGGSNSHRSHWFKYYLWQWAEQTGLEVRVAHTPVYCSKYNPIERRVFPYVEQVWRGRIFRDAEQLAEAARSAATSTGLQTTAHVFQKEFTPRGATPARLVEKTPTMHDKEPLEYNYIITPNQIGN